MDLNPFPPTSALGALWPCPCLFLWRVSSGDILGCEGMTSLLSPLLTLHSWMGHVPFYDCRFLCTNASLCLELSSPGFHRAIPMYPSQLNGVLTSKEPIHFPPLPHLIELCFLTCESLIGFWLCPLDVCAHWILSALGTGAVSLRSASGPCIWYRESSQWRLSEWRKS